LYAFLIAHIRVHSRYWPLC